MQPIRKPRPTSPARAAAARANGAKSRGPVTARGKAISSRNGSSHRLQPDAPIFNSPESLAELAATVEVFERDNQPQSPIERMYVHAMAESRWRRRCLLNLEFATFRHGAMALTPLLAEIYRLDIRYSRQYTRACRALSNHRAVNPEKMKPGRRTPQGAEKPAEQAPENPPIATHETRQLPRTDPPKPERVAAPMAAGYASRPEKIKLDLQTPQPAEKAAKLAPENPASKPGKTQETPNTNPPKPEQARTAAGSGS